MLVLTRKQNETTTITTPSGETITVCIVLIKGDSVRLGFDARREINIVRDDAKMRPAA